MACPQTVDGEDGLQIWKVDATDDQGWSSSLGLRQAANKPSLLNVTLLNVA